MDLNASQMISTIKRRKLMCLFRSEAVIVGCFLLATRLMTSYSTLRLFGIGCALEFTFLLHIFVEVGFHSLNAWHRTPVRRPYVFIASKAFMTLLTTTCVLLLLRGAQSILLFAVVLSGFWTYLWCYWRELICSRILGHCVCFPPIGWNTSTRQHISTIFGVLKQLWLGQFIVVALVVIVKILFPSLVPRWGQLSLELTVMCPILTAYWISGFLRFDEVLNSQYNFGNPQELHHFKSVLLVLTSEDQIAMRFGFAHLRRLAFLEGALGRESRRQLFTKVSTPTVWENCVSCCCLEIKSMTLIIARVCERLPDFQSSSGGFTTTDAWNISQKIEHKCMILSHCVGTLTGLIIAACSEDHQAAARSGEPSLGDAITVIFEGFFYLTAFWKGNKLTLSKSRHLRGLLEEFEAACLTIWNALRTNVYVQMKKPYHVTEQYLKRAIQALFQDE